MNQRSKFSKHHAEGEAPMPAGEVMAILGQMYVAVLLALIIGVANVDIGGFLHAAGTLQFGDPAMGVTFTA